MTPDLAGLLPEPDRPVDEERMTRLVDAIGDRPELWRPFVRHDEQRHCASFHADEHFGIWVISWLPGHDTGWHDHAGSIGAVAVVEGVVEEIRPAGGHERDRLHAAARHAFSFGEEDVHRVVCTGDEPAVTIHAYWPPLAEMGIYRERADGTLERTTIDWDQVLTA